MAKGMSMVLLRINAGLMKRLLASNMLDPRCKSPVTMKNTRATFLILIMVEDFVFIGAVIIIYLLGIVKVYFQGCLIYISRMLNDEQVKHVAKLARIKLTDQEVKKFGKQLSSVLEYIDILAEVDTKNVPETSQVTGLKNVMDKDEVIKGQSSKEELLKCSELPVDSGQVRVIRVVK